MKTLYDISWQVTEPEYRQDPALSYSSLARYEREGFSKLESLQNKVESASLTNGSAVDALITGGSNEFNEHFIVADIPNIPEQIKTIVKDIFEETECYSLEEVDDEYLIKKASLYNYQNNWKPSTRAKVIKEKGSEYFKFLYLSGNKTILTLQEYQDIVSQVSALKESESTKWYFQDDNPFDGVIRHYQLKFKATFDNIDYRCMSDCLIELSSQKLIIPTDLKTSGKPEYLFHKSFVEWDYAQQARLYWRIIRDNMDRDEKYKEWTLADYRFIVVNKKTLNPLVWIFKETQKTGTLYFGKTNQIEIRDPFEIGKELRYYLDNNTKVPVGIDNVGLNDISEWLNKQ